MHQIARESASRLCGKVLQNKERSAASKITCCPSKKYTRKQIVALSGATSIERNCHSTLESAGGAEKIKNWIGRQSKQEVLRGKKCATTTRTGRDSFLSDRHGMKTDTPSQRADVQLQRAKIVNI